MSERDDHFDQAERLDHIEQIMDRILTALADRGGDVREIRGDVRLLSKSMDGLRKAFTDHLSWHLRRQSA